MTTIEPITAHTSHPVERPVMYQGWENISFLHWRYPPATIARLLPDGLQPDTFDGSAWVGLTPFVVTSLRPPYLPALPWISRFPEMNVRTYVTGPDGGRGIWFFSLEAARLAAVLGARLAYGLPYRWAHMRMVKTADGMQYGSQRRFGRGAAAITVEKGMEVFPNERDLFLTARFQLYTRIEGRLARARVEHPPWPLTTGRLLRLDENVMLHSGLPAPAGEPLLHYSSGVYTRIGRPVFLDRR